MPEFGYEIDFLAVGDGDKSGDAIALRYGLPGDYRVMIVDGGTKDSGEALVAHVRAYYGTDFVHDVVNTHPDDDHTSGLSAVLEELRVGTLWMHRPWDHSSDVRQFVQSGRITDRSLTERFWRSLDTAAELERIALRRRIPVVEPFQGDTIGCFTVLGPSEVFYERLLAEFRSAPATRAKPFLHPSPGILTTVMRKAADVALSVFESWGIETLSATASTSAENESSVILYGNLGGCGVLLTGDAGVEGLDHAASFAELLSYNLPACRFVQVPHHGSRNNLTPVILDRILGPRLPEGAPATRTAFASASKSSTTHPRRKVTNAFQRRGSKLFATKGISLWHHRNMGYRAGWGDANPLPFYDRVEEE